MNELQAIVNGADSNDGPMILATVVDVDGSAYRRPGARMLILANGEHIGMISGGCLERDLCRQAAALCEDGPRLISFDTRSESTNFNARYNLGCSGIIYILVEAVTKSANCPLQIVREVLNVGCAKVVGTVYQSDGFDKFPIGSRVCPDADDSVSNSNQLNEVFDQVSITGRPVCCQIVSRTSDSEDSVARIFVERVSPPKPFWIFGAGDDAMPMSNLANELGWSVSIIDDRAGSLTSSRFPAAKRLLDANLEDVRKQLVPTSETAAVLMTHSFSKDAMYLPWLCESGLAYVGLLGPKSRTGKLVRRMHNNGVLPDAQHLDRLRTPVGLDIGAANPAQIAVAIAAEIISLDNERQGGSLSHRNQPIHEPVSHQLIESDSETSLRFVETK